MIKNLNFQVLLELFQLVGSNQRIYIISFLIVHQKINKIKEFYKVIICVPVLPNSVGIAPES